MRLAAVQCQSAVPQRLEPARFFQHYSEIRQRTDVPRRVPCRSGEQIGAPIFVHAVLMPLRTQRCILPLQADGKLTGIEIVLTCICTKSAAKGKTDCLKVDQAISDIALRWDQLTCSNGVRVCE